MTNHIPNCINSKYIKLIKNKNYRYAILKEHTDKRKNIRKSVNHILACCLKNLFKKYWKKP